MEDWVPFVDISETDGEFHIKAELPVLKKEDMRVAWDKGVRTLQGNRKAERQLNEPSKSYDSLATMSNRVRAGLPKPVGQTKAKRTGTCSTSIIGVAL